MHTICTPTSWDPRPPLYMALQSLVTAILICFTDKHALSRWAAAPLLLYLAHMGFNSAVNFSHQVVLYCCFTLCSWTYACHCLNLLCLQPLDKHDIHQELVRRRTNTHHHTTDNRHHTGKPTGIDAHDRTMRHQKPWEDISTAYKIYFTVAKLWSLRGVNTSWQIKSLPSFPSATVPSRTEFLTRQIGVLLLQYILLDLLISQPQSPESKQAFLPGKEWLWLPLNPHPVTTSDLIARAMGTLMSWFLVGPMMTDMVYRFFAVIFVGILNISPVEQWPPLYGSYRDCFTLRRYFNKFWHQCHRMLLQGFATFFISNILGFKSPGSIIRRYAILFVVFFHSGLNHVLLDTALGIDWRQSGGLIAFLLIDVGIMLEDFAQWAWGRLVRPEMLDAKSTRLIERLVGYVWVFFWLFLCTPIYNYPYMRINPDTAPQLYVIPWSIVGRVRERMSWSSTE